MVVLPNMPCDLASSFREGPANSCGLSTVSQMAPS